MKKSVYEISINLSVIGFVLCLQLVLWCCILSTSVGNFIKLCTNFYAYTFASNIIL